MVNEVWEGQTLVEARGDTDRQIVRYAWRKGRKRVEQSSSLCPSRELELNNFYQVKRKEKRRHTMKKKREERREKREERKRREKMKENIFSQKNVSRPSNPPAQNFSKKNPRRTNYSSIFSSKVQNLTVFSIIYMIRIRFVGPEELIQGPHGIEN